jgi:hypothetical protein
MHCGPELNLKGEFWAVANITQFAENKNLNLEKPRENDRACFNDSSFVLSFARDKV